MQNYLERYRELHESLEEHCELMKDFLWVEYNRMIVPFGPAEIDFSISRDEARDLLARFPNCLLVRCTNGIKESPESHSTWYAVILSRFGDLNEMNAKKRKEVRKGLNNCSVEMVDASYISEHGFNVFSRAYTRYKNVNGPSLSEAEFKKQTLAFKDFDDIVHLWGVFHEHELVGYAKVFVFGKTEANYSTGKFDPTCLKHFGSAAMFHLMNKFYLEEQRVKYVNTGFRNILHETNVQEYLISKFAFYKAYTEIGIFYRPYLAAVMSGTFPFRSILGKLRPELEALYKLEEIRRESRKD